MNKLIKEPLRRRGKGWFEIRNLFGILEAFDINKFEEKKRRTRKFAGYVFQLSRVLKVSALN